MTDIDGDKFTMDDAYKLRHDHLNLLLNLRTMLSGIDQGWISTEDALKELRTIISKIR